MVHMQKSEDKLQGLGLSAGLTSSAFIHQAILQTLIDFSSADLSHLYELMFN